MQGFPGGEPDTKKVEPFLSSDPAQIAVLSERLLERVRELEELMEQVRTDLDQYRVAREEWQIWHSAWKRAREKKEAI
ncbi:hypothetical protein [Leptospira idonii]|uniref:hypothetical protein n=1 Tax=Leptospira idonii TaxID=1193500 RepID=UPI001FE38E89|nr:hypothetical protein [Leptospira idonii]